MGPSVGPSVDGRFGFCGVAVLWYIGVMRVDFEELVRAAHWGGILGLVVLVPSSCLMSITSLGGDSFVFGFANSDRLQQLVRLGIEIFLMAGWGFAAVSLVRQATSRAFGAMVGALVGGLAGTLVINLMGVIFAAFVADAPPVAWGTFLGLGACLVVGFQLSYGPPPRKRAGVRR